MTDLRINDVEPDLQLRLKVQAAQMGRTLRDHVLVILRKATRSKQASEAK